MGTSEKKTLLVGLDAACWEYLDPLLDAGQLPTIKKLMHSGTWGTLRSTLPASTPTAWASIVTGKNPGKHGVFDFLWKRPNSYDFVLTNSQVRLGTPFWMRLNDCGIRTGMVNVPFTHPPKPVEGFVVCGFGAPSKASKKTYPDEALDWIEEKFGEYHPSVDVRTLKKTSPLEVFQAERNHQLQQVQIATSQAIRYGVDVLVINLMLLDHANHYMPDMELVNRAIIESDADLSLLLNQFEPDNVMLISDHGSRRVQGDFLLHSWLLDQGYVAMVPRTPSEQISAFNWMFAQWLSSQYHRRNGLSTKVLRRVASNVIPKLPYRLTRPFWEKFEGSIPFARKYVLYGNELDFATTKVFPGSQYNGVLYFNKTDNEPSGLVDPERQIEFSEELISKLMKLEDPRSGVPLFTGVHRSGDLFSGPMTSHGPDIILDSYEANCGVLMVNYQFKLGEKLLTDYFIENRGDFGWHSRDGIFVFSGCDFSTGPIGGINSIMDIPATLLHLYNVPIPDDYDGQSIVETLSPSFVKQYPLRSQTGDGDIDISLDNEYSDDEMDELMDRLRALGYVE